MAELASRNTVIMKRGHPSPGEFAVGWAGMGWRNSKLSGCIEAQDVLDVAWALEDPGRRVSRSRLDGGHRCSEKWQVCCKSWNVPSGAVAQSLAVSDCRGRQAWGFGDHTQKDELISRVE